MANRWIEMMASAQAEMNGYKDNVAHFISAVGEIGQHYIRNSDVEFYGSVAKAEQIQIDTIDLLAYRHSVESKSAILIDLLNDFAEIAKSRMAIGHADTELHSMWRRVVRMTGLSSDKAITLADGDASYAAEYIRSQVNDTVNEYVRQSESPDYISILTRFGEYVFSYC